MTVEIHPNQALFDARIQYIDCSILELNAVANLIENSDPDKHELLVMRVREVGLSAQAAFESFRQIAAKVNPQNPALFDLADKGNEN